jgi:uncharacterized membrane protein (DUF106 family)
MEMKNSGIWISLAFVMLMMVAYSIQWIRVGVGSAIDVVFGPFIDDFRVPFFILIIILSTVTALYSSIIQKYTIDYERMAQTQEKMKEFQKEYREATLSKDEKALKKLEARRNKAMAEQLEMSQQQFTPMAYILVLTVPIFFWLLFRLASDHSLITLPLAGSHALAAAVLGPIPAWIIWYMICSIAISQVIRKSLNIGGI